MKSPEQNVYLNMRSLFFEQDPEAIGITKNNFPYDVWAVLMETGVPEGSYSLNTIADGTTSLYFSTGGGIIGGGEHEQIKNLCQQHIISSQGCLSHMSLVTQFSSPELGKTIFYFKTFDGVYAYTADENDLGYNKDVLSDLFHSSHNIIASLRQIQESKNQSLFSRIKGFIQNIFK